GARTHIRRDFALAARPAAIGMREDRAGDPLGISDRFEDIDAAKRMVFAIRMFLVIEVMDERDKAPRLLILAPHPRVAANRGFDCDQMTPQAFALDVVRDQRPCPIARELFVAPAWPLTFITT